MTVDNIYLNFLLEIYSYLIYISILFLITSFLSSFSLLLLLHFFHLSINFLFPPPPSAVCKINRERRQSKQQSSALNFPAVNCNYMQTLIFLL